MIKLILADSCPLLRDGISALLKEDNNIKVTGEACNADELHVVLATTPADVVLLDLEIPDLQRVGALERLCRRFSQVKILAFSVLESERQVHQTLKSGVAGYILRNAGLEELRSAVQLVAAGTLYISSNVSLGLLQKATGTTTSLSLLQRAREAPLKELSRRELEVLHLISEGFTNAQIAEKLFASKRTIETHRQNLLEKTKTKNTAALVKHAVLYGLVN
ncbi:LuxR family two component transcriptional regulator [Pontibacter ummariensis]|uniref:Two component transcriptional regulator, LuxR family n=1 Tax=Pontibacter ummariensis TaxID=1610492 RepID=A0A239I6C6_9BACT|nr:response regulator transcription factor [Pontibacter ummariensis]PRY10020.1 LuxR family two component transcriptional regulator [Pontibacter ummariensis]SNS89165.1 two component transcriptional regulator, LuxR family [Pontibacter ummariensis]